MGTCVLPSRHWTIFFSGIAQYDSLSHFSSLISTVNTRTHNGCSYVFRYANNRISKDSGPQPRAKFFSRKAISPLSRKDGMKNLEAKNEFRATATMKRIYVTPNYTVACTFLYYFLTQSCREILPLDKMRCHYSMSSQKFLSVHHRLISDQIYVLKLPYFITITLNFPAYVPCMRIGLPSVLLLLPTYAFSLKIQKLCHHPF